MNTITTKDGTPNTMKVLIVLTSHSDLGNTGKKTGFWVEEFASPYYELADAGRGVPSIVKSTRLMVVAGLVSGIGGWDKSN